MKIAAVLFSLLLGGIVPTAAFAQAAGKDFHDQEVVGQDFTGHALNNANFADATLKNCKFINAVMKGANLKDAVSVNTSWYGTDLTGADLRGFSSNDNIYLNGNNFTKANLEGFDFKTFALFSVNFREANLRKTTNWLAVDGCDFTKADLRGANLHGMKCFTSPLTAIRFRGALYDEDTTWPEGFDPVAAGAILSKAPAPAASSTE